MKTFKQYIEGYSSPLHDDAILMPLGDFIDLLQVVDAQRTDQPRMIEIREGVPEPGALAIRLLLREEEDETE